MVPLLRRLANPAIVSALLALALFAITLNGVFIYDDVAIVETDRRIAHPNLWGQYWTDSYNFGVDNLYRPLVSMSYAIQYWLHGPRPLPFHLVNWMLHAATSALVAMFAMKLARRCEIEANRSRAIGLIAGILFAVHPIHVEAVANVVGRAELMCAIGVVGAMLLFLSPLTRARVAGIYACFVLALLSKEQGMLVPLLLGVMAWGQRHIVGATLASTGLPPSGEVAATGSSRARQASPLPAIDNAVGHQKTSLGAILFVLLAVTLAGYVSYRESILKFWWDKNFLDPWIQPLSAPDATYTDRLLVPITIAGRYLQLLVAPVTLRLDYGGLIVPGKYEPHDPYFYLGLGAIVLWLALFAIALRQRDRFSLICLLGFALIYGLLGNLVTIIGVNMAERLMYLPSVFFVMLVARWMSALPRKVLCVVLALLAVALGIRSVTYAMRWNDKLGFYVYSANVEPRSLKATQLAMQEYLDRGDLDQAETWANRALAIKPDNDDAILRLAMVKMERGDFGSAEALINRAESLNPAGKAAAYRQTLEERRAATQPAH